MKNIEVTIKLKGTKSEVTEALYNLADYFDTSHPALIFQGSTIVLENATVDITKGEEK